MHHTKPMTHPQDKKKQTRKMPSQCVHLLADYLRKIDPNGLECFLAEIEENETPADINTVEICYILTETLRTRWQIDILEPSGTSYDPIQTENLEDRENTFAVLERAECFGLEQFCREFLRLATYVLENKSPETL